jgi:hypothetical protein
MHDMSRLARATIVALLAGLGLISDGTRIYSRPQT